MPLRKPVLISIGLMVMMLLGSVTTRREDPPARPTPPSYGQRGTFNVGTRDLTIGESSLVIRLWYPSTAAGTSRPALAYHYDVKMDRPFGTMSFAAYAGQATQDTAVLTTAGPYPLVILSPGFSLGVGAYAWLAEHLASYGFVVIAPEHQERLDSDLDSLWQATVRRPQDMRRVLAYVDEQVRPGGALEGQIDPDRLAVVGHSYGGFTALATAGARIDTIALTAHCLAAQADEHPTAWLCDTLVSHLADMAAMAGMNQVPEGLWPDWGDARVDAVVSLAGDAFQFGPDGLEAVTAPVLAIGGTRDTDSPFDWGSQPTYGLVSSSRKVLIALNGAEHMIFTGPCEQVAWYMSFLSGEFCDDGDWDRLYAHDLVRHYTTAFLLAELYRDNQAATALIPNIVSYERIAYEAIGYGPR